jgi:hypothetical protein
MLLAKLSIEVSTTGRQRLIGAGGKPDHLTGGFMKKAQYFAVGLGFALFSFMMPAKAAQPSRQTATTAAEQQQSGAQHLGLLLGGKILVRHGHYDFYNTDTHTLFRIVNPAKAKKFKGDTVRVQGKVNAQRHTIYIESINSSL